MGCSPSEHFLSPELKRVEKAKGHLHFFGPTLNFKLKFGTALNFKWTRKSICQWRFVILQIALLTAVCHTQVDGGASRLESLKIHLSMAILHFKGRFTHRRVAHASLRATCMRHAVKNGRRSGKIQIRRVIWSKFCVFTHRRVSHASHFFPLFPLFSGQSGKK